MNKSYTRGFVAEVAIAVFAILALAGVGYLAVNNDKPKVEIISSNGGTEIENNIASVGELVSFADNLEQDIVNTTNDELAYEFSVPASQDIAVSEPIPVKISEELQVEVVKAKPVETPALKVYLGEPISSRLLLHDAKRVPFTNIILEAVGKDVNVSKLVVERKGLASDRVFGEIGVTGVDSERSPNSNHQYETRVPFTIEEGETMEITLFGNIATELADYDGQMPTLALVKIEADTQVEGELPLVGTAHKVNSTISIGTLNLSIGSFDPSINRTLYINDKNVIFTGLRITTDGAEPVKLNYVSWNQNGSAGRNDIENVVTVVVYKGETYTYDTEISEDGKFYTSDLGEGIKIGKGETADIYVKGDIGTTGVGRTVDFDIYGYWDVEGIGANYGQEIDSTGGDVDGQASEGQFSNDVYPFFNAYAHTISAGSATSIGK